MLLKLCAKQMNKKEKIWVTTWSLWKELFEIIIGKITEMA